MRLCKYVTSDRVDILRDARIRFTQPTVFNDPFEMAPVLSGFGTTIGLHPDVVDWVRAKYDALPEDKKSSVQFEDLLGAFQNELGIVPPDIQDEFRKIYDAWPEDVRKLMSYDQALKGVTAWMKENDSEMVTEMRHLLLPQFFADTGVLSLAERPDNLLMWSHYADQHRGFIIEFDSDHPFFDQREDGDDEFNHLTKVTYSTDRATTTIVNFFGPRTFFTKSHEWEYEQEWRMLVSFQRFPHKKFKRGGDDIRLVSVPPDCICRVILGHRMPADKKSEILDLVTQDTRYGHVEVLQAELDSQKFSLNFRSLADHYAFLGFESLERAKFMGALKQIGTPSQKSAERLRLAISDFGKAIRLAPDDTKWLMGRGLAYAMLGKYKEAIKDFSRAIIVSPEDGDLYVQRAAVRMKWGESPLNVAELKLAEGDLERAVELGLSTAQDQLDLVRDFLAKQKTPAKKTTSRLSGSARKKKRSRK